MGIQQELEPQAPPSISGCHRCLRHVVDACGRQFNSVSRCPLWPDFERLARPNKSACQNPLKKRLLEVNLEPLGFYVVTSKKYENPLKIRMSGKCLK